MPLTAPHAALNSNRAGPPHRLAFRYPRAVLPTRSYPRYHTVMATVRKTVTLPRPLVDDLAREAGERRLSFSAVLAERASRGQNTISFAGIIDDDPDLSLKVEEILRRQSER